jgi:hypothetical protein
MKHERKAPKPEGNFQALGALQDSRFSTEGRMMAGLAEFFFDCVSPYAYLANTQLSKLEVPIPAVGGCRWNI